MEITENVEGLLKGYFKIEKINPDTKEVLEVFEEENQIQAPIHFMTSRMCWKGSIDPNDFIISGFAIGTDGLNTDGSPKTFNKFRKHLFSENNFWNGSADFDNSYVYQVHFEEPPSNDYHTVTKISEGATFPHENGVPTGYQGTPYNDPLNKEAGVTITRSYENYLLNQEIYVGKYAANGIEGENPPKFSEASFFMNRGRTIDGTDLGAPISMKTFPGMTKTDECVIRITWNLDFSPV